MNQYVPPALTSLLNMSTVMTPPDTASSSIPSYQLGGMVGPGGEPIRPNIPGLPGLAGPSQGGLGPQQMELEARRFVQQNPQQVAEIRTTIEEALADGDITMDQVQLLTNMAKVALQNPEMYPALKQAVVARGVLEDDELPPEFDQGTLFILLLIGQIMQSPASQPGMQAAGGTTPPAAPGSAQMQQTIPSMKKGGALPMKSEMDDEEDDDEDDDESKGGILIMAHEGEYVIPTKVVRAKGTEFFDKLVQSYTEKED